MAAMLRAKGESVITETVFDSRFGHVSQLREFGAVIRCVGPAARIRGTAHLHAARVRGTDLRGTAALVLAALQAGLRPIVCVGETLEQRQAEKTMEVIESQVRKALDELTAEDTAYIMDYVQSIAENTNKTEIALKITTYLSNTKLDLGDYNFQITPFIASDGKYTSSISSNNILIPVKVTNKQETNYGFNTLITVIDEENVEHEFTSVISKTKENGEEITEIPTTKLKIRMLDTTNLKDKSIKVSLYKRATVISADQTYELIDLKDYGYSALNTNYKFNDFNASFKNKEVEEVEIELDISNLLVDGAKVDNLLLEEIKETEEVNEFDTYILTLENNLLKLEEEIKDYYDIENQKISSKINELDSIRNKKINEAENVFKESIKLIDKKYEHILNNLLIIQIYHLVIVLQFLLKQNHILIHYN